MGTGDDCSLCPQISFDRPPFVSKTEAMPALKIIQIPCLTDNYCVLLHSPESGETAAIDAPQAEPVVDVLDSNGWRLNEILVTHHHGDHTAGCLPLKARYGCRVTGPDFESERIPGLSRTVNEATGFQFAGHEVRVLETPGHTLGHVSFYLPQAATVFTGDTLFALGCGRIFEGDAQGMYASLQKIAALPDKTAIYCGHEYTLANARFALSVEPENAALTQRVKEIEAKRARGEPTLPTTVGLEKATNPFLRTHSSAIRARLGLDGASDWQVFAQLRALKNKA